ncbi:phosphotransferase enzyme family protein-like protein [Lepidopterella palustris CBS 459.81]|uniref:Phosphotransferase enzyme family protein-like protein n=1 Tax=Lepidopterella palustris CBS 459.81 TaxID=1314670 RepID=A0A8E2DZA0_9PEZI|nr:phosphotransferase enzyme family protein-like protein [Lepidopterella palustris CBS 459.81]
MGTHEQPHQSPESLSISENVGCGPFPYNENIVFRQSSFFKKPEAPISLPSPLEVKQMASQSTDPRARTDRNRPPPVTFPKIGLLVKYGREVTIAEGQTLLFIRNTLSPVVPVPEVYGWCKHDGQTFIYMELIDGITLEKSWDTITEDGRVSVCQQLRYMVDAWRGLKQDFSPHFIGDHVGRQPLLDIIFTNSRSPTAGPFPSVSDFHDWFTTAYGPNLTDCQDKAPHPYRSSFPDGIPRVFTHADLHPSNIILSSGPSHRWYPAYWEYCKARWTSWIGEEWEAKYLSLILDRYDVYDYWDYFNFARGV